MTTPSEAGQISEALRRESTPAMKVAIYNENCTLAGREVSESTIERWDEADGEPCDWTTYEGTPEELLAIAAASDKTDGAPGRANLYGMRVAEILRREVYRFHPELEPIVCTKDDPEWDDDE